MLEGVRLPKQEDHVFSLTRERVRLGYPPYVLLKAHRKRMTFGLTDTAIKLYHFHCLETFRRALHTMLVKGKLAVRYVLLRPQQSVVERCLQARWAPEHEL